MGLRPFKVVAGVGIGVFLLVAGPSLSEGAEEKWQTDLSATYTSGDYGTNSRTDILYMPFSLRRLFEAGDLTLVVPYIHITSDGNVTLVNGVPNKTGRLRRARTPARVSEEGIGDVVLKGRYYVLDEQGLLPTFALTARVKAPTADADRGLGTGEWDEGFGAEVSKRFAESWVGYFDLGYTIIGKPAGVPLRNQWNYDAGLGYYFTKVLLGSVYYEEWRALLPGQANPRDLLFLVTYKATPAVRFNVGLETGLSDGAPDYGLTAGLSVRF
jgi:hypothetical protein